MKTSRIFLTTVALIMFSMMAIGPVRAEVRGKIKGTVTGNDGQPIQGVKITFQSLQLESDIYTTKTEENGNYVYVGLKPVLYKITFEKENYQTYIENQFKLRVGIWVSLDVKMYTIEEARKIHMDENLTPEEKATLKYNEAMDAFSEESPIRAIELLEEATTLNPNFAVAYEKTGILYFVKMKDNAKANASFQAAMASNPASSVPYEYLGAIALQENDHDKAEKYWKTYFELDGDSGLVAENLAVIYMKKEKFEDARKMLELGMERDPEYPDIFKKHGELCMQKMGDYQAAITSFTRYLELKPDAPDANVTNIFITELGKAVKKQQTQEK